MRRVLCLLMCFLMSMPLNAKSPWPAANSAPPVGWTGPVFQPNFDFPAKPPQAERHPWDEINFRTDPKAFLKAVLSYILEGMGTTTRDGRTNTVRQWYHAPWMHEGFKGREFIHGLTRERSSQTGELGPGQTKCYQNWAVAIANPAGGYTYGQVWGDGTALPDPRKSLFMRGTVFAKLLFTQATASDVPLLTGAPEWEANIHDPSNLYPKDGVDACPNNRGRRFPQKVRLLQFDVAVRHASSELETGWVSGTFIYDGRISGDDPWAKLKSVGLMWGHDPQLTDAVAAAGAKPKESIVLPDFGFGRHFGCAGRMNGPIDSQQSACLSFHGTAQYQSIARMIPSAKALEKDVLCWFRKLRHGTAFGYGADKDHACGTIPATGVVSTDTSLQIAIGLKNYTHATGAHLPTALEAVPSEMRDVEARRAAEALENWYRLSARQRSSVLERAVIDRGLLIKPISRGDPERQIDRFKKWRNRKPNRGPGLRSPGPWAGSSVPAGHCPWQPAPFSRSPAW